VINFPPHRPAMTNTRYERLLSKLSIKPTSLLPFIWFCGNIKTVWTDVLSF